LVITPLISADMWRHDAGLRSGPDQRQYKAERGDRSQWLRRAHRIEGVAARCTGKQAEAQQQRQPREARHDDVDIPGLRSASLPMMRHHQRPGNERHQLPSKQKAKRIVSHYNEVEGREKGWIERQHTSRVTFVPAVAERVKASSDASKPHHNQKARRERIEAEMRADPWQPKR
jgi:hypothetical protein